jgi:arylsulfatase A-like enzyme
VYEEAIRTPFILWGRGVPKNVRNDSVVENVDLYPTLCSLAGIEPPRLPNGEPQLQGRDLTTLFARDAASARAWRDHSFSTYKHIATIREHSTGLKLIVPTCDFRDAASGVAPELFHLPSDPDERRNLWSERPADALRLRALMQRMIVEHHVPATTGFRTPADVEKLRVSGYDEIAGSSTAVNPSVECAPRDAEEK